METSMESSTMPLMPARSNSTVADQSLGVSADRSSNAAPTRDRRRTLSGAGAYRNPSLCSADTNNSR